MWFSLGAWGAGSPTCPGSHRHGDGHLLVFFLLSPQKKRYLLWKAGSPAHSLQISRMVLTHQATRSFRGLSVPKSGLRLPQRTLRTGAHRPLLQAFQYSLDLGQHLDAVFLVGHGGLVIPPLAGGSSWVSVTWHGVKAEENAPVCQGDPSPLGTDVCICSSCPL